eukprot:gene7018-1255_t
MNLHASDWVYRAEGGKHLVVAYAGDQAQMQGKVDEAPSRSGIHFTMVAMILSVLRLVKQHKQEDPVSTNLLTKSHNYALEMVAPWFGAYLQAGQLVPISAPFLQNLAARVHASRPVHRTRMTELCMSATTGVLQDDAAVLRTQIVSPPIVLEIKPKAAGMTPLASTALSPSTHEDVSGRPSLRSYVCSFQQCQLVGHGLSAQCPSACREAGVTEALEGLVACPQNNLHVWEPPLSSSGHLPTATALTLVGEQMVSSSECCLQCNNRLPDACVTSGSTERSGLQLVLDVASDLLMFQHCVLCGREQCSCCSGKRSSVLEVIKAGQDQGVPERELWKQLEPFLLVNPKALTSPPPTPMPPRLPYQKGNAAHCVGPVLQSQPPSLVLPSEAIACTSPASNLCPTHPVMQTLVGVKSFDQTSFAMPPECKLSPSLQMWLQKYLLGKASQDCSVMLAFGRAPLCPGCVRKSEHDAPESQTPSSPSGVIISCGAVWSYSICVIDVDQKPYARIPSYCRQDLSITEMFAEHLCQ